MLLFLVPFVVIQFLSLVFLFAALYSLYSYIKKFRFEPSQYDLLFGFIHLRFIAGFYILATLFLIGYQIFFVFKHYG